MTQSMVLYIGTLLSGVAFLGYGWGCLFSEGLKREFTRFGLPRYRVFIGITQLFGGAGLIAGPWSPVLGLLAASGLTLQMAAGILVRIRVKDSFLQSIQALLFFGLNLLLAIRYGSQM